MNISARTEYACIAVLELALRRGGDPVRIRSIADAHGIPSRFLVQILLQLKGAGLVRSTRGAAGGYHLAKSPQEITLAEIMEVVDGPIQPAAGSSASDTPVTRALHRAWQDAGAALRQRLAATTVAELAEQAGAPAENMYYI